MIMLLAWPDVFEEIDRSSPAATRQLEQLLSDCAAPL
eukprot:COSAG05_NODE_1055_length_6012_cov_4.772028_7_plen_37_part_00